MISVVTTILPTECNDHSIRRNSSSLHKRANPFTPQRRDRFPRGMAEAHMGLLILILVRRKRLLMSSLVHVRHALVTRTTADTRSISLALDRRKNGRRRVEPAVLLHHGRGVPIWNELAVRVDVSASHTGKLRRRL